MSASRISVAKNVRRVVHAGETGGGGDGHEHARIARAETDPPRKTLAEQRTQLARRDLAADRGAGADDEDLQQHVHHRLPCRHAITVHGLLHGRHPCRAGAQQPPGDAGDRKPHEHGEGATPCGDAERTRHIAAFDVSEEQVLDAIQHQREQPRGHADQHADHRHRDDQRRQPAESRLLPYACTRGVPVVWLCPHTRRSLSRCHSRSSLFHPHAAGLYRVPIVPLRGDACGAFAARLIRLQRTEKIAQQGTGSTGACKGPCPASRGDGSGQEPMDAVGTAAGIIRR